MFFSRECGRASLPGAEYVRTNVHAGGGPGKKITELEGAPAELRIDRETAPMTVGQPREAVRAGL
jgi:hypothetical protein